MDVSNRNWYDLKNAVIYMVIGITILSTYFLLTYSCAEFHESRV